MQIAKLTLTSTFNNMDRKAYWTQYYAKNKVHIKEKNKRWSDGNVEKRKEIARTYNLNNKEKIRNYDLVRQYGITLDEYNEMVVNQNNRCAVCYKTVKRTFHVDHNHLSGKVRGLLCTKCNLAIGLFSDSFQIAQSAADYLLNTGD